MIFSSLQRRVRYACKDAGAVIGLHQSRLREARGTRMIVYHGICLDKPTRYNSLFVTKKTFEAHLKYYKRHFHVVSLEDYYAQRFEKDRLNLCLTFDDGFANNFTHALPLLERYEVPATFFVTGIRDAGYDILWNDFMGLLGRYGPGMLLHRGMLYKKNRHRRYYPLAGGVGLVETLRDGGFDLKAELMGAVRGLIPWADIPQEQDYWLQMTEPQIRELSHSGMATIGCHGYYHNDLGRIASGEAGAELKQSKDFLEQLTGKEIKSLAFPYGSYTRGLVQTAMGMGFSQLLALDFLYPEDRNNPALKERFTINPFISVHNQMLATVKGHYAD